MPKSVGVMLVDAYPKMTVAQEAKRCFNKVQVKGCTHLRKQVLFPLKTFLFFHLNFVGFCVTLKVEKDQT